MICGNEEAIILRCLESAKYAFDELCIVSAIGSQTADKTLYKAEKWCAENGKMFHAEHYRNAVDLPHVDNFGAARNLSFSLATGDWLLWLDCDDYIDEINCRRIREAVNEVSQDTAAIHATYCVQNKGAEIMRERLIRRGKGVWKNPIHETCIVSGTVVSCPQIRVYHSDHGHKSESSSRRNAAILRRTLEDTGRHLFYLHSDATILGNSDAAALGHQALAVLRESQVEERYFVLLNLAKLEPEQRQEYLHLALRIQPHRREAMAQLCQVALNEHRISDAVSFFRMMDSLPLPVPLPWTHQSVWYGWGRNALRVRILRECGKTEEADAEHARHMKEDPEYAEGHS